MALDARRFAHLARDDHGLARYRSTAGQLLLVLLLRLRLLRVRLLWLLRLLMLRLRLLLLGRGEVIAERPIHAMLCLWVAP